MVYNILHQSIISKENVKKIVNLFRYNLQFHFQQLEYQFRCNFFYFATALRTGASGKK